MPHYGIKMGCKYRFIMTLSRNFYMYKLKAFTDRAKKVSWNNFWVGVSHGSLVCRFVAAGHMSTHQSMSSVHTATATENNTD